jgi:flagellar M-ring protein FliF
MGLMVGLVASVAIGAAVVLWLWIPGSGDYFGDNSPAYSSTRLQDETPQFALQARFAANNNRFDLIDSRNDNNGKVLSLSGTQLEYTQKLEAIYTQRIERLLEPLLGADAIRAQVTADIDFTAREQTLEKYNPDSLALRNKESEEIIKDHEVGDNSGVLNKHRREVKNYEIDKTIRHTRSAIGRIDKLSIAVIVDDKLSRGVKGNTIRTPHTEDEIKKLADLVKKAVGFNSKRGDIVNVMGASFKTHRFSNRQLQNKGSIIPTWNQVWMKDLFNKTLGTLLVLLLIFAVIRPAIKSLVNLPAHVADSGAQFHEGSAGMGKIHASEVSESNAPGDFEKKMNVATRVVANDPKLVAQIMKNWVSADGT